MRVIRWHTLWLWDSGGYIELIVKVGDVARDGQRRHGGLIRQDVHEHGIRALDVSVHNDGCEHSLVLYVVNAQCIL